MARTILITGAASGIGKLTALRMAEEGARIVIADIQDDKGEAVAKRINDGGGEALYINLDVTSEDGWAQAVAKTVEEFIAYASKQSDEDLRPFFRAWLSTAGKPKPSAELGFPAEMIPKS